MWALASGSDLQIPSKTNWVPSWRDLLFPVWSSTNPNRPFAVSISGVQALKRIIRTNWRTSWCKAILPARLRNSRSTRKHASPRQYCILVSFFLPPTPSSLTDRELTFLPWAFNVAEKRTLNSWGFITLEITALHYTLKQSSVAMVNHFLKLLRCRWTDEEVMLIRSQFMFFMLDMS